MERRPRLVLLAVLLLVLELLALELLALLLLLLRGRDGAKVAGRGAQDEAAAEALE